MTHENSRLVLRYSLHQVIHWMSTGILIPVIVLLQRSRGLSLLQVGTVMALYSTVIILLEIPTGGLADTIGRKRTYLLSSLVKTAGLLLLLFSAGFLPVLAAFSLYGISRALDSGALDAWFVDEHGRGNASGTLQRALAVTEVAVSLGLGVSAMAGGLLPDTLGEAAAARFGLDLYSANIAAAILLVLTSAAYTLLFIHEPQLPEHTAGASGLRSLASGIKESLFAALKERNLLLLLISVTALGYGLASLETFWQPRAAELAGPGVGSWIFGALATGYFAAAALGSLLIIPVARSMEGRYNLLLAGTRILFALGVAVLAGQQGLGGFSLWYILLFTFNGASSSPHQSLLNSFIPSQRRSTMLSVSSFALQLGGAAGSLVGGILAEHFSIPLVWTVSAAVLALSSLCYLLLPRSGADGP